MKSTETIEDGSGRLWHARRKLLVAETSALQKRASTMKQIDLVQKFRSGDRTVKGPKDTKDLFKMTFSSCHRKMHQDSWGLSAWQYADKPPLQCTKSGVRKIAQKELQICQKDSFKKTVDFAWSPICDFWMLKTNGRFEPWIFEMFPNMK